MEIDFLKCKTCIVQANCGSPCEEYREYIFEKLGVRFDAGSTFSRRFLEKLFMASSNIKTFDKQSYTMDIDLEKFENDKL